LTNNGEDYVALSRVRGGFQYKLIQNSPKLPHRLPGIIEDFITVLSVGRKFLPAKKHRIIQEDLTGKQHRSEIGIIYLSAMFAIVVGAGVNQTRRLPGVGSNLWGLETLLRINSRVLVVIPPHRLPIVS
jgi:hypothetical protein